MRRAVALLAAIAAAVTIDAPARANDAGSPDGAGFEKVVEHRFFVPVPCAQACPYALEGDPAACNPEPIAVPPPAGMYEDWDFRLRLPANSPNEGIVFLVYALSPAVDHDGWMCLQDDHEDNPGSWYLGTSGNVAGDVCGAVPMVGCREKAEIGVCVTRKWNDDLKGFEWDCVPANSPVRFRDFNYADPVAGVPAWVCWSTEGIKPGSTGCAGEPL